MARPCKIDTVNFRRVLREPERAILLTAGSGDLTRGWNLLLEIYSAVHAQGFRPEHGVDAIGLVNNAYNQNE